VAPVADLALPLVSRGEIGSATQQQHSALRGSGKHHQGVALEKKEEEEEVEEEQEEEEQVEEGETASPAEVNHARAYRASPTAQMATTSRRKRNKVVPITNPTGLPPSSSSRAPQGGHRQLHQAQQANGRSVS